MKRIEVLLILFLLNLNINSQDSKILGFNHSTLYSLDLTNGRIDTIGILDNISGITGHTFDIKNGYYIHLMSEKVFIINPTNAEIIQKYSFPVVEIEYLNIIPRIIEDINKVKLENINIYPNPTRGQIYLNNFNKKFSDFHLIDAKGIQILHFEEVENIDISNLSSGIY